METTIFDYIKSILFSKKKLNVNIEDKSFIYYMVNKWISMYSPEMCSYINETSNKYYNQFTNIEDQYNFLFHIMPKVPNKIINYIKKPKKDKNIKQGKIKSSEIDYIKEYANNYELSRREIEMYLTLSK